VRYSTLQFSVIDEGDGFTEKEIKKLFKKDESKNNIETGLGIGLSNVKDLCDLMKGHLQVISEKGVGSSFILELELEDLSVGGSSEFEPKKLENKIFEPKNYHILVVEDNPVNQMVFEKLLEKEGFNVSLVGNGLEALASLRVKSPDLILMDLRMPEMGGIEAAKHIRTSSEFGKSRNVPIIAVTAHDDSLEKNKCFEVGMNDYITKPINKDLFLNVIETQIMGKN
jgi:CheY-like chemotaxis protein